MAQFIRIDEHVLNLDQVTHIQLSPGVARVHFAADGTWVFSGAQAAALQRYLEDHAAPINLVRYDQLARIVEAR